MDQLPRDLIFLLSTYLGYEGTIKLCQSGLSCAGIWEYKLQVEFNYADPDPQRKYLQLYDLKLRRIRRDLNFLQDLEYQEIDKIIKELTERKVKIQQEYEKRSKQLEKQIYNLDKTYLVQYGHKVTLILTAREFTRLNNVLQKDDISLLFNFIGKYPAGTLLQVIKADGREILYIFISINQYGDYIFNYNITDCTTFFVSDLPQNLVRLIQKLKLSEEEVQKIFNF